MRGCSNPIFGQIWTNPKVGLKMQFKNVNCKINPRFNPSLSCFNPDLG